MSDTTSKDDELFEAINNIVEGEHAHYINKLKPLILPLIKQYGLQERIDELEHVEHPWFPEYVLARKAELTALKDKEDNA